MPNPVLTVQQRDTLFAPLFANIVARLEELSGGDHLLLFALRRKLAKELQYLERGTPSHRKRLKVLMRAQQQGLCPICRELLPQKDVVLDRTFAPDGYTEQNTRLIHRACDYNVQALKKFS